MLPIKRRIAIAALVGVIAFSAAFLLWHKGVTQETQGQDRDAERPRTRHGFARAMAKVKEGMTEKDVLALLGKPEDVRAQTDPGGISTTRTREIWRYGTAGHLTFPTLG